MRFVVSLAVVFAAVLGAAAWLATDQPYRVSVVLDSAANIVEGGYVLMNGATVGEVGAIDARDGKARLSLEIDSDRAPLHDGAVVNVDWKATLGERRISIEDGPASNPAIPDNGMIKGRQLKPMELDEVLDALDPPTREHVKSALRRLESTLQGREGDVNQTIQELGPTLGVLGDILRAINTDGPAIKNLVARLNDLTSTLAKRDQSMRDVVRNVSTLADDTARHRDKVRRALGALPPTLEQATRTLGSVPETVETVSPLLRDLRPATEQLPATAANLRPVLQDLRPLVSRLGPTIEAANVLLDKTPALLDVAHRVVPTADDLLADIQPALRFLRPYTPELAGWLASWGSAGANYDANGHYWRMHTQAGLTALNANPGVLPPGVVKDPYPLPGANADQPWNDAFGDGQR